jgi:hypothetical protein
MSGSCDAPAGTVNGRPRLPGGGPAPPGARSEHPHPNQVTPPVIRCRPGTSLLHGRAGQKVRTPMCTTLVTTLPQPLQTCSRQAIPASRRRPGACSRHPHPNQVAPPVIRCRPGTSLLHGLAGQNHAYEQHYWLSMAAQSRSRRAVPASRGSPADRRATARQQGRTRTARRAS